MSSNEDNKSENQTTPQENTNHGGCRRFWKIPFIILIVIGVKSTLVMYLWNALIPDLFHGPELTLLQALGLTLLAKILVGGFGHGLRHKFGHHHWHHKHCGGKNHMHRWMRMSREERQKMRDEIHAKFHR